MVDVCFSWLGSFSPNGLTWCPLGFANSLELSPTFSGCFSGPPQVLFIQVRFDTNRVSAGIEAYCLFHSVKSIQRTDRLFYFVLTVGLSLPLLLVLSLFAYSWLYSADVYIRTHPEGNVCFLTNEHPFNWILIAPVAFVMLFNLTVAFMAVTSAYRSAKFRYDIDPSP